MYLQVHNGNLGPSPVYFIFYFLMESKQKIACNNVNFIQPNGKYAFLFPIEGGNGLPQKLNTTRSLFFRCGMMLETTFNFGFCIILQQKRAQKLFLFTINLTFGECVY